MNGTANTPPANVTFGRLYGGNEPAFYRQSGLPVWMFRKRHAVRFYDASGRQVGPEQRNVCPAVCYAMAHGWTDSLELVALRRRFHIVNRERLAA